MGSLRTYPSAFRRTGVFACAPHLLLVDRARRSLQFRQRSSPRPRFRIDALMNRAHRRHDYGGRDHDPLFLLQERRGQQRGLWHGRQQQRLRRVIGRHLSYLATRLHLVTVNYNSFEDGFDITGRNLIFDSGLQTCCATHDRRSARVAKLKSGCRMGRGQVREMPSNSIICFLCEVLSPCHDEMPFPTRARAPPSLSPKGRCVGCQAKKEQAPVERQPSSHAVDAKPRAALGASAGDVAVSVAPNSERARASTRARVRSDALTSTHAVRAIGRARKHAR
eukprot:6172381-Pleurochrysis_carterae.AAC.1